MISSKKVLAVIPARGGSKGLPGKNIRTLYGKPLIAWSIEQALACPEIDTVIVSTDDPEIARVAALFGAKVPFLRPKELASDTATSIDVVLHAIDFMARGGSVFDLVVLLEPTSPLREVGDISGAIKQLHGTPNCQSVVGVSQVEGTHPAFLFHMHEGWLKPYLGVQPTNLRRQDIEELYFLEGSVYVSCIDALKARRSFYHECTAPWIVPRYKSFEIDELADFIIVEALMSARQEGRI
ncbi:MAG: acylneuraminate cytidylyltransferase family protein [Gallionella sp.]|nr:acylneuraminate cytidylyltransferase family protein [Gallionella sp.]